MYFFTNGNLYRSPSKGALVREFVETFTSNPNPEDLNLLEMFVNDMREMDLSDPEQWREVYDHILGEWEDVAVLTFMKDCDEACLKYTRRHYVRQYKTECHTYRITFDEYFITNQVLELRKSGWKVLTSTHAKAKMFLNHQYDVLNNTEFGAYMVDRSVMV